MTRLERSPSRRADSRRRQWLSSAPTNRPTLERSSTLSLQSRDRKATHDPTAIHSACHDASKKERVEHAHVPDDTQDPNPGAISSRHSKCALAVSLDEGIACTLA